MEDPRKRNPKTSSETRWKPKRWQVALAAIVAAAASLGGILIATLSSRESPSSPVSSPSSESSTELIVNPSSTPSSGSSLNAVLGSPPGSVMIDMTSSTSEAANPPPGESYSFRGVIKNLPAINSQGRFVGGLGPSGGSQASVFVVECELQPGRSGVNGYTCLKSPAGHITQGRGWFVQNWRIQAALKDPLWSAMVVESGGALDLSPDKSASPSPNGSVHSGLGGSFIVIPPSTPLAFVDFALNLLMSSRGSVAIDAFSRAVSGVRP